MQHIEIISDLNKNPYKFRRSSHGRLSDVFTGCKGRPISPRHFREGDHVILNYEKDASYDDQEVHQRVQVSQPLDDGGHIGYWPQKIQSLSSATFLRVIRKNCSHLAVIFYHFSFNRTVV